MSPTGWRPTAFYRPLRTSTAYTNAAILDSSGHPVTTVEDPVDASGILLDGPWILTSYDTKWGHANYSRPDGWDRPTDGPFKLSGTTKEPSDPADEG